MSVEGIERDAPLGQTQSAPLGQTSARQGAAEVPAGNYRQRSVREMSQPPGEAQPNETRKDRRAREAREAVAELKARAEQDHAVVDAAQRTFDAAESEARREGRPETYPFSLETAETVLAYVEQAIPLADYSEFPGAPSRPGACTLAGIPYWTFRRWCEGSVHSAREWGAELRSRLARAREIAADTLADRHLHLAQVALETPRMSDAVRVAAEILRWQASIRNRSQYGDQVAAKPQAQQVVINIGVGPAKRAPVVIDAETVPVLSRTATQAIDGTGTTACLQSSASPVPSTAQPV